MINLITKRMKVSIAVGVILGVFCIIGASVRSGFQSDAYWLFSLWYNRLLMGLVIGLSWGNISLPKAIGRGAILGLIVSFAFYSSTGFIDVVSFLAGVVYGMIIEYFAFKFGTDVTKRMKR
ncbi:MAG: hypothetical protein SA378_03255 [Sedimentibacter sp.]|uniref:hypothetical protein n=1 Tax=Sedimentibacter sp. TaxID=1960295 RepID=UPI002981062E|nr:hypothetical protein [Sedimentibacter sp.]MDW5299144.1 hypothetical protein [Sedimentibacter sp.]